MPLHNKRFVAPGTSNTEPKWGTGQWLFLVGVIVLSIIIGWIVGRLTAVVELRAKLPARTITIPDDKSYDLLPNPYLILTEQMVEQRKAEVEARKKAEREQQPLP